VRTVRARMSVGMTVWRSGRIAPLTDRMVFPSGRIETGRRARPRCKPNAHAGIRNVATGEFRRKGHANIAAARRYYGRDDQHVLALYGYL
jgi:hypothetical protein